MADKVKYPTLGNHFDWSLDYVDESGEFFDAPSMCEPVHNLTLEEIVRDYSRGILHRSRTPIYDDGDDVEETEDPEDLVDVLPSSSLGSKQAQEETVEENPKTPPAATPESAPFGPEQ